MCVSENECSRQNKKSFLQRCLLAHSLLLFFLSLFSFSFSTSAEYIFLSLPIDNRGTTLKNSSDKEKSLLKFFLLLFSFSFFCQQLFLSRVRRSSTCYFEEEFTDQISHQRLNLFFHTKNEKRRSKIFWNRSPIKFSSFFLQKVLNVVVVFESCKFFNRW